MFRLLVIDDDLIISKVLVSMFKAEKYEVQVTHTAEEGMKACIKELPDIVLLDVNLPDGNGLEICRKMKENPLIKHIPVIILTGGAIGVEDKVTGLESGAEDYVIKSCIADEIVARVAGILKRTLQKGA